VTQLDGFADAHLHLPSAGYQRKRVGVAARMKLPTAAHATSSLSSMVGGGP
jgi:hypothetical protein